MSEPTVDAGVVYVGGFGGWLWALDAASGDTLWTYHLVEPIPTDATSAPIVLDDTVFMGAALGNGAVVAVDARTGSQLWRDDRAAMDLVASYGQVYADGPISFDATSGTPLWDMTGDRAYHQARPVGAASDVLYVVETNEGLMALDALSGRTLWTFGGVRSRVALADGVAYASGTGYVFGIDTATGAELWRSSVDSHWVSSPVAANGVVVVGSGDGVLYAFSGEPRTDQETTTTDQTVTEQATTTTRQSSPPVSYGWSRLSDEAIVGEGRGQMLGITASELGLVAIGSAYREDKNQTYPTQVAAVWTSADGTTWTRVRDDPAAFGAGSDEMMYAVVTGGPGLVAVGKSYRDVDHQGYPTLAATVWTSRDGINWIRVPDDKAVLGKGRIRGVTSGGPGFVAVGVSDDGMPVWTSPDGTNWAPIPDDAAVLGGANLFDVTSGGPGLVAVGSHLEPVGDVFMVPMPAVWTSADGTTWARVAYDGNAFGDEGGRINAVTVGGPGLVAVGESGGAAAAWTSTDGMAWTRVPHDDAVFGRAEEATEARIYDVTVGGPGLVAAGAIGHDAAVWTSTDGTAWKRVEEDGSVFRKTGPMFGIVEWDSDLIAVGGSADPAVWIVASN